MQKSTKRVMSSRTHKEMLASHFCRRRMQYLCFLVMASISLLSACGSGSSSRGSQPNGSLAGNWQFSMASPDPNYPSTVQYALQGGFLLQSNGRVSGTAFYSIALDQLVNGLPNVCNGGAATITGTVNGDNVTLTADAGGQTFSLTGALASDGLSMGGTYTTSGGAPSGSTVCGAPTPTGTTQTWNAISVPSITGAVSGSFHSIFAQPNEDFALSGSLVQGPNIGAGSATVTGTLSFLDPNTLLNDYPCFSSGTVSVNGQVSGNTIILQLIGTDGSPDGQIGIAANEVPNSENLNQVTFDATPFGNYLHSTGAGYQLSTASCPSKQGSPGDIGYVCLALNSTAPCQQPITLSPAALVFPPQFVVCTAPDCPPNGQGTATTQTITLTNNQPPGSNPLTNLTLNFQQTGSDPTDFTNIPDFNETDNCSNFLASSTSGQSCTITVAFAPQESCNWVPSGSQSVARCPLSLGAVLTVVGLPSSADNDTSFAIPISGKGYSWIQPSVPELDFGAEALGQASQPQQLTLTNQSPYPVQIVGPRSSPCQFSQRPLTLPRPTENDGAVAGLQVVTNVALDNSVTPPTIRYNCDADQFSGLPDFQISIDTCTGINLAPQASCSVEISFVPQPMYAQTSGLDYFLELNTVQCAAQIGGAASDCEIDSGRFPVELTANGPSPLRMSPGAGLDFGGVKVGSSSAPQTITLVNDPSVSNPQTVTFVGKFVVSGSYSESDDCPVVFAPAAQCTLTFTFKPGSKGFSQGTTAINYTLGSSNVLGVAQNVYLRGTGQ